jgi:eukaryotic-like serine/threonine-protein kinase
VSTTRYRLIRRLGTGNSTAGVFLAEHLDLGRQVAVKLLELHPKIDRAALLDEAKKMASLPTHDNVVQVLDAGDWDTDHVYIASDVCLDGTLESITSSGQGVDPALACRFISDACRGLDHMHRHGLLHMDVRPANIFLAANQPKMGDFGLSRWSKSPAISSVYTPHAAPELFLNLHGSQSSDQYAMAMSMIHILTAGIVCRLQPADIPKASAAKTWPPIDLIGLNVPDKLKRVLARATLFDSSKRYADIEHFKRAVDGATPAVAFRNVDNDTMESTDGQWMVQYGHNSAGHFLAVIKKGRRDSKRSVTGTTDPEVRRRLKQLVTELAG